MGEDQRTVENGGELFLVERKNLTVAIKKRIRGGGADDNSASVEHEVHGVAIL